MLWITVVSPLYRGFVVVDRRLLVLWITVAVCGQLFVGASYPQVSHKFVRRIWVVLHRLRLKLHECEPMLGCRAGYAGALKGDPSPKVNYKFVITSVENSVELWITSGVG